MKQHFSSIVHVEHSMWHVDHMVLELCAQHVRMLQEKKLLSDVSQSKNSYTRHGA
jgi:hypothetical protein